MPDVWTTRPDHLMKFLNQLGAECGVESRILKPRDPNWTCHINGEGWIGDVYIHNINDLWFSPVMLPAFATLLILGFFLGLQAGKIVRPK